MRSQIQRTLIVKPLRNNRNRLTTIQFISPHNRIDSTQPLAIQHDNIRRNTTRHQRVPHTHRLINPTKAVIIATYQYLLNLLRLKQSLGSINTISKKVVTTNNPYSVAATSSTLS